MMYITSIMYVYIYIYIFFYIFCLRFIYIYIYIYMCETNKIQYKLYKIIIIRYINDMFQTNLDKRKKVLGT